jgi:hypothetical protein
LGTAVVVVVVVVGVVVVVCTVDVSSDDARMVAVPALA